jgi:WD40 repeat protein/tetratricopeptide (TPR) repeat protein
MPAARREGADPIAFFAANLAVGMATTVSPEDDPTEAVPGSIRTQEGAGPAGMTAPHDRTPDAPDHAGPGEAIPESSVSTLTGRSDDRYYREVARLGIQVAEALEYAHRRGVLHRDIKPPNLVLDPLGNIWITDFGLAKFEEGEDLSHSQDVIGTLRYMAPERFRGVSTARCDVYALGATLYETITLRPPFQGKDQLQLIRQVENDTPVPPREIERNIPRDLETIVLKALAKSPEDRFSTAKEMADELRRFVENRPIRSRPIPMYQRLWRWCKRDPGLAGASLTAAALVVVLAVVSSLAAWNYRTQLKKVKASQAYAVAEYKKGQEKLFQAHYDRAQAQRFSRREGQRFQSLAAIEEAVRIGRELRLPPESFDRLRDQAIACLALPDLEPTGRAITRPPGVIAGAFDLALTRHALRFRDGAVSVRRVADEQEIARFKARGDRDISVFGFSPDGRYLATTHRPDPALSVWDIDRRAVALEDPGPVNDSAAKFSPDSRRIAVCHQNGELLVYNLVTGQPSRRWRLPAPAHHLAFRGDGAQVAIPYSVEKRWSCGILEVETGRLVRSFPLPGGNSVAWSPDGTTLATACDDQKIYLWDAATGIRRATLEGHINLGLSAAFHPAGTLLASGGWEGRTWLWDPVLGRPWLTLTGGLWQEFSPDGRLIVGSDSQFTPYLVDPALEYRTFARPSDKRLNHGRVSVHRDGRLLALGTDQGAAIWDLARGTELAFLPIGLAQHVMFEPSGDVVTSGAAGVERWPIRFDPDRAELRIGPPRRLAGFPPTDCGLGEDRSGRIVAVAYRSAVHVLTPQREFTVSHLDDCRSADVSPDGQWLATGSSMFGGVRIWRIADGAEVSKLRIEGGTGAYFSPDGKWLMTDATPCRLWEVGTWQEYRQIGGYGKAFSPDGRQVVVQDSDQALRLVEAETGRMLARFESPDQCFGWTTFSPDGSRLVVSTNDGPAVHVWDLRRIRRRLAKLGLDWDAPAFPEEDPADQSAPPLPPPHVDYGPLAGHLEQFSEDDESRLRRYTARLETAPKDADAYHHRGHAPHDLERYREAIDDLTRAIELRPRDAHFLGFRAHLYEHLKHDQSEIADLEAALKLKPDQQTVRERLAHCCNHCAWELANAPGSGRDLERALSLARRAVELAPSEGGYVNTLGVVLYRAGRYAESIDTLELSRTARRGQIDGFDLFFQVMAHHRLNHLEQARSHFEQARSWMEAHRNDLDPKYLKELTDFRAEAEAVLAGPGGVTELPDDVFAEPR